MDVGEESRTPDPRRWAVLAAGVVAISVASMSQFGLPYLIPHLRAEGLSLGRASLLTASPSFGLMATLVLWGAAADRWGERLVLAAGLTTAAPLLGAAAAVLVLLVVRDAPRPTSGTAGPAPSPYRTPVLWRLHSASALLVLPQLTVATFGLTYLVDAHGWSPVDGGRLLAVAQVGGAAARLLAGWWSDQAGSRTGPLRLTALAVAATLGTLTAATFTESASAVAVLVAAAVITVSPNGLAFTAVAEYAGSSWAGRALGLQNTAQNAVALTPPLVAALVAGHGYASAFLVAGAVAVLAVGLVPHPLPQ